MCLGSLFRPRSKSKSGVLRFAQRTTPRNAVAVVVPVLEVERVRLLAGLLVLASLVVGFPGTAVFSAQPEATSLSAREQYAAFRREVVRETANTYRRHRASIDPVSLRGKLHGYDLDHIQSVRDCHRIGMTVQACAAPSNLQIIPAHENRSMGCKSVGCRSRS